MYFSISSYPEIHGKYALSHFALQALLLKHSAKCQIFYMLTLMGPAPLIGWWIYSRINTAPFYQAIIYPLIFSFAWSLVARAIVVNSTYRTEFLRLQEKITPDIIALVESRASRANS